MCHFRSGEAVLRDGILTVLTCPDTDSHTEIRARHGMGEDRGFVETYHTPLELIPVRGLFSIEDYDFVFDAGKPSWWKDEFTETARRQLFESIEFAERGLNFSGNLDLRRLTSLPENVELSAGGGLDLSSLTSLPENVKLSAWGSLDLHNLTNLPENAELSAGGSLYLWRLTNLPENIKVKAKYIYFKDNG
jgi:hypothetical protein